MKAIVSLSIVWVLCCITLCAEKLILHMDVNKTIIAEDKGNNKNLDDVLIECLAKEYKGYWDNSSTQKMTYVQYVKEHLYPGDKSDRAIRKKRNEAIHAFFEVLKQQQDERYIEIASRFNSLKQKVRAQDGVIFRSFLNLIAYLDAHAIEYSIILRTFGTDLSTIVDELSRKSNLRFAWEGCFKQEVLSMCSCKTGECEELYTPENIFSFFNTHTHICIRDDFKWWNEHREHAQYGKLFPIGEGLKTVFFDDNADERIINPRDYRTGCVLDCDELIECGVVCVVDTLGAIENDNYFIDHLKKLGYINN